MPAITPQYSAGFLDGEGNVTILERNRRIGYSSYGIHVGFTNRDLRPLRAIQFAYGGTIFQKKRANPKHSQAYELRVGKRKEVKFLLESLLPFLICKRAQAELGLEFLSLGKVKMEVIGMRKIHSTKGGQHPIVAALPGEQEKRAEMKTTLMLLNKRGAA